MYLKTAAASARIGGLKQLCSAAQSSQFLAGIPAAASLLLQAAIETCAGLGPRSNPERIMVRTK